MDYDGYLSEPKNWVLVGHSFDGLDYVDSEYEVDTEWFVGDSTYYIIISIYHDWVEHHDPGDYYTPPSDVVVDVDFEFYIQGIYNEDGETVDINGLDKLIEETFFKHML